MEPRSGAGSELVLHYVCQHVLDVESGGTHLLEKLFSGRWDGQFLVLEKGTRTNSEQILI